MTVVAAVTVGTHNAVAHDAVAQGTAPNISASDTSTSDTLAPQRQARLPIDIADSLSAARDAKKLQSEFEKFRYKQLPRYGTAGRTPCDEKIGRFCYWHRETDTLIPEPETITNARLQLLYTFDTLRTRSPHDQWIIGTYVHYLIEAGYDSSAYLMARECQSNPWWCQALRGYALHAMQRFADAEMAYDSALVSMETSERCAWNDISLLLSDDERDRYRKQSCAERQEFEKQYWKLADPGYAIPGNDRKTEHFSRLTTVAIMQHARNPYGLAWGDDLRELTIRYGPPLSFSKSRGQGITTSQSIVGHGREPSYHFAPLTPSSDTARWDLKLQTARERYSPRYVSRINPIDAQFGMFKRGDSALVVAIYADTLQNLPVLGVTSLGDTSVASGTDDLPNIRRTLTAWKGVVAGVERYDTATRHLDRAREWLAPPAATDGAPALSTLLLFAGDDTTTVSSLEQAIRRALVSPQISSSQKVGIYWEMYGAPVDSSGVLADSAITISLSITPVGGGFFRWLAQSLRLTPKTPPMTIGWRDLPGHPGGASKSVVLDLSELRSGDYRITLAAETASGGQTTTVRDIRIR